MHNNNLSLRKKSDVLVTDGTFSIMSVLQTQMPGGALTENWKQNTCITFISKFFSQDNDFPAF